ncbi:MAG: hypothetical protein HWD58_06135 [Bacteroidota bacterium]|nr:MAG: hypothetical protein HWD58_06135 [Bacteroidota bacterium]
MLNLMLKQEHQQDRPSQLILEQEAGQQRWLVGIENLDAKNNKFDVGSGLQLPIAMNFAERTTLESKLTHDFDNSCLGVISYFDRFITSRRIRITQRFNQP